jgi:uncharacterized protein (DUF2164 family)
MDDDSLERREIDKTRFRLDATINVAHILTTIGMVYALFNWGSGVNAAQAVQESKIQTIRADRERDRAEMLQALREINNKLDRMEERGR